VLGPLREYVRRKHTPQPDDFDRLIDHYLELAVKNGNLVGTEGGAEAIARLAPEVANIKVMIGSGLQRADQSAAIAATDALRNFAREQRRRVEVRVDDTFPDIGGRTVSFMPQPRTTDLIEEVARRLTLDPKKYWIQWCLRDQGGQYLKRDEGVVRNFRASMGIKQSLVLTIPPRREGAA
jgi:hypothetical protein